MTTRDRYPEARGSTATDERGFSLIELIIALALLGVIFGAAMPAMYSALNVARNNRNRSIAADLASQQIDIVRDTASSNFTSLGVGDSHTYPVVGGVTYDVDQFGEWVAAGATTGACNGSSADNAVFLRITVLVSWPNMGGGTSVQNQTILTPPVGSYSAYTGAIAVKVTGVAALQQDVPVQITPTGVTPPAVPPTPIQNTGPDGCAYFSFLAPGTYTVTLNKPFYVGGQGNQPITTINVTVTIGTSNQLTYDYDKAASVTATFVGNSAPAGVVPPGVPLTIFNNALLPSGAKYVPGTGSPQVVSNLYPYLNGYQVWAGDCADSDPQGAPPTPAGPYYPGAIRPPATNVIGGGASTAVTLTLPSVDVKVTHLGLPVIGATVTAIHAADPNSCNVVENYPSTVLTGSVPPGVLRMALPYGTWSFRAAKALVGVATSGSQVLSPLVGTVPMVTVSI